MLYEVITGYFSEGDIRYRVPIDGTEDLAWSYNFV